MYIETLGYDEMPRATRQAIVRDLSQRVLEIVTAHHPEQVLGAEIQAQITETTPVVDTAEGEPIGKQVVLSDMALAAAQEHAIKHHGVEVDMRGNQLAYRLQTTEE